MQYQNLINDLSKAAINCSPNLRNLINQSISAIGELEAMVNGESMLRQRAQCQVEDLLHAIDGLTDLPLNHSIYEVADRVSSKIL